MDILEAARVPKGLPVTFRGMRGNTPVVVAAVLRPSNTPGRWMVWPDDSRMVHRPDLSPYLAQQARRALDGPISGDDAARRFPDYAREIRGRRDSSD